MDKMSILATPQIHGYAVEFSPLVTNQLACVACQEYGISGMPTMNTNM